MSRGTLLSKASIPTSEIMGGVRSKLIMELIGKVIIGWRSAMGGVIISLAKSGAVFLALDLEGLTGSHMDSLCFPNVCDFDGVRYLTSPVWKAD